MFLLEWYREWLDIRASYKGQKINLEREVKEVEVCQSCETLKEQLSIANDEKRRLLDRLMEKPVEKVETGPVAVTQPRPSRHLPWSIRQQALEQEDRRKAQLMKDAPKPDKTDVSDLEKELDIASTERETAGQNS